MPLISLYMHLILIEDKYSIHFNERVRGKLTDVCNYASGIRNERPKLLAMIRMTIVQYGLDEDVDFSAVSDSQLDHITQQFVTNLPHCGERSFDGYF